MEEKQVSFEGKTEILHSSFVAIATQNALEQSGTYPLAESQLDRFLFRLERATRTCGLETRRLRIGRLNGRENVNRVKL